MKKLYTLLVLFSFGFTFGQVNYLVEHFKAFKVFLVIVYIYNTVF